MTDASLGDICHPRGDAECLDMPRKPVWIFPPIQISIKGDRLD